MENILIKRKEFVLFQRIIYLVFFYLDNVLISSLHITGIFWKIVYLCLPVMYGISEESEGNSIHL